MRTKIIAGLGPTSAKPDIIQAMIEAGVDIFRFNFAHGDYEEYKLWGTWIKEAGKKLERPVEIYQDLSGPRLRVGTQPNGGRQLVNGQRLILVRAGEETSPDQITTTGIDIMGQVKSGERILLANGEISLQAEQVSASQIEASVISGGLLKSNKSINLPDSLLTVSSLTEKDKQDFAFGLSQDYAYVGISFVQDAEDIHELRPLMPNSRRIIAKIERQTAINNIDAIIEAADIIMIARGDMGAELPIEEVPFVQKMIIKKCNLAKKPSITATQMLTSMIEKPYPTRAEVSDIANAVLDGTSAVWLSDETTIGQHPVECVKIMRKICEKAESYLDETLKT